MANSRWALRDSDTFSTSSATTRIGEIYKNEEVEYLNQKENGYAYIEYNTANGKKRGWVYANDLAIVRPAVEVGIRPVGTSFKTDDYPNYPSGNYHGGTDIGSAQGANHGDAVKASFAGKVVTVVNTNAPGTGTSYGNYVVIESIINGSTYRTWYCHMESVATGVKQGDTISKGQTIGYVGNTGNCQPSTYYHLHLEYRVQPFAYATNNVDPKGFY